MTRILLVEDDATQLANMLSILQKTLPDYQFIAVGTLSDAVAKLRELWAVSLVVADYQLPDGTGYDLLEYCKSHLTDVPFIILAYSNDQEKGFGAALFFQKGVFDYVRKPIIDFDEFIERIKRSIRIAHALT